MLIMFSSLMLFFPFILNTKFMWVSMTTIIMMLSFFSMFLTYSPLTDVSFSSPLLLIDPISAALISLTLWITALMIMSSNKIFSNNNNTHSFLSLLASLALILILSFSMSNLLSFYIMFEASLIPTVFLILGWGYQPERLQAGLYLTLYTVCASLPLLMNLSWIYYAQGSLSLILSPMSLSFINPLSPSMSMWWALSMLAFMVKMPIYLFHLWLPKAHVEAPVAGSMILAGLLLKLGSYGALRISTLFQPITFSLAPFMTSIAMWGGAITSFICIRQTDIKSLIAYSSIGHMAFVIMGVMLCSSWGWQGAIAMMIAHGLCSSCMFSLANMTYEGTSTRSMFLTKGILSLFPAFSLCWFMLSVCNMAAPPSINLFSEISLIMSGTWFSFALIIPISLCTFLACAYSFILFTSTNHGSFPAFLSPHSSYSPSFYSICLFHFLPIWLMILKPELISSWL